jgi:hypothetical protein
VAERVEVGADFPFTEKTPPATAAGVVELLVFEAADAYAANESPDTGEGERGADSDFVVCCCGEGKEE